MSSRVSKLDRLITPTTQVATLEAAGRLANIVKTTQAAMAMYQQVQQLHSQWKGNRTYSIRISSLDDLYPDIHRWLLQQMTDREQKSLIAQSTADDRYDNDPGDAYEQPAVKYLYDGKSTVTIKVQGHPIEVSIDRDEPLEGTTKVSLREDYIMFLSQSVEARTCLMRTIEEVARKQGRVEAPRVYIATEWNHWQRAKSLAVRDPGTVVLADGLMERLSNDLGQFLKNEEIYSRIGIPWHRGYLLHGPSGTGKTSAARALASAHQLDVYYLPLSDVKSDTNLVQMISNIKDRSILLIEDIDIAHAAISREEGDRLTLQGLLNALDGALTPQGLITIMTTNHIESLDPALIRKGRCDLIERIDYLTDQQLSKLVTVMTGKTGPLPTLNGREVAAVEIAEIVKRNIENMDHAWNEIVNFLNRPMLKSA